MARIGSLDPTRGKQEVADDTGWRFYQCHNKRVRDGYCRIHHPEERAARRAKRPPTKFEREMEELKRRGRINDARKAVIEAARNYLNGSGHDSQIREALAELDKIEAGT